MSSNEASNLTFNENDQSSIKAAIDKAMLQLTVPDITGWRLPTLEEIEYIANNNEYISLQIQKIRKEEGNNSIKALRYATYSYYYQKTKDEIGLIFFSYDKEPEERTIQSEKGSHILRAFATVYFNN